MIDEGLFLQHMTPQKFVYFLRQGGYDCICLFIAKKYPCPIFTIAFVVAESRHQRPTQIFLKEDILVGTTKRTRTAHAPRP